MAGKEGEADQKQKQVRKQHPFICEMGKEAGEARAFSEAFAQELLDDDGAKTDEGGGERVAVKDRDEPRPWRRTAENRSPRPDRRR